MINSTAWDNSSFGLISDARCLGASSRIYTRAKVRVQPDTCVTRFPARALDVYAAFERVIATNVYIRAKTRAIRVFCVYIFQKKKRTRLGECEQIVTLFFYLFVHHIDRF